MGTVINLGDSSDFPGYQAPEPDKPQDPEIMRFVIEYCKGDKTNRELAKDFNTDEHTIGKWVKVHSQLIENQLVSIKEQLNRQLQEATAHALAKLKEQVHDSSKRVSQGAALGILRHGLSTQVQNIGDKQTVQVVLAPQGTVTPTDNTK